MTKREEILNHPITYKPTYKVVDWGSKQRGQGKRVGNMVKGGMSDAPTGVKKYPNVFGNLPDYNDIKNDLMLLDWWQEGIYMKCRSYGMNHNESMDWTLQL